MTKLYFVLFFCISLFCQGQRIKLEIEFRYGQPDCSGKCKTDAEIQNSKIDKPLARQRFYVYQSGHCVDSIKTNDSGLVVIKYHLLFRNIKIIKVFVFCSFMLRKC